MLRRSVTKADERIKNYSSLMDYSGIQGMELTALSAC